MLLNTAATAGHSGWFILKAGTKAERKQMQSLLPGLMRLLDRRVMRTRLMLWSVHTITHTNPHSLFKADDSLH